MILDILVNGQRVDVLDRSSINLRLNNVIYNPTEINNTQAEYSFSFNLPTTPNNNKIFDYANVLSKINKFQNTYDCEVYSDEVLIFNGSLRIQSIKKGFYNVNLVNIKINTIDEIFGDMKLNELDWKIPFTGIGSINTHNANANSKVIFHQLVMEYFKRSLLLLPMTLISTQVSFRQINIINGIMNHLILLLICWNQLEDYLLRKDIQLVVISFKIEQ